MIAGWFPKAVASNASSVPAGIASAPPPPLSIMPSLGIAAAGVGAVGLVAAATSSKPAWVIVGWLGDLDDGPRWSVAAPIIGGTPSLA